MFGTIYKNLTAGLVRQGGNSMREDIVKILDERIASLLKDARLTESAGQLVRLTITSIGDHESRPPSGLGLGKYSIEDCQLIAIDRLPKVIEFVAIARGVKRIGVFDLLELAPQIFGMFFIFKYP
jgi:hypothetical protein